MTLINNNHFKIYYNLLISSKEENDSFKINFSKERRYLEEILKNGVNEKSSIEVPYDKFLTEIGSHQWSYGQTLIRSSFSLLYAVKMIVGYSSVIFGFYKFFTDKKEDLYRRCKIAKLEGQLSIYYLLLPFNRKKGRWKLEKTHCRIAFYHLYQRTLRKKNGELFLLDQRKKEIKQELPNREIAQRISLDTLNEMPLKMQKRAFKHLGLQQQCKQWGIKNKLFFEMLNQQKKLKLKKLPFNHDSLFNIQNKKQLIFTLLVPQKKLQTKKISDLIFFLKQLDQDEREQVQQLYLQKVLLPIEPSIIQIKNITFDKFLNLPIKELRRVGKKNLRTFEINKFDSILPLLAPKQIQSIGVDRLNENDLEKLLDPNRSLEALRFFSELKEEDHFKIIRKLSAEKLIEICEKQTVYFKNSDLFLLKETEKEKEDYTSLVKEKIIKMDEDLLFKKIKNQAKVIKNGQYYFNLIFNQIQMNTKKEELEKNNIANKANQLIGWLENKMALYRFLTSELAKKSITHAEKLPNYLFCDITAQNSTFYIDIDRQISAFYLSNPHGNQKEQKIFSKFANLDDFFSQPIDTNRENKQFFTEKLLIFLNTIKSEGGNKKFDCIISGNNSSLCDLHLLREKGWKVELRDQLQGLQYHQNISRWKTNQ